MEGAHPTSGAMAGITFVEQHQFSMSPIGVAMEIRGPQMKIQIAPVLHWHGAFLLTMRGDQRQLQWTIER